MLDNQVFVFIDNYLRKLSKSFVAVAILGAAQPAYATSYIHTFGGYGDSYRTTPGEEKGGWGSTGKMQNSEGKKSILGGVGYGKYLTDHFALELSYAETKSKLQWQGFWAGPSTSEFYADTSSKLTMVSGTFFFRDISKRNRVNTIFPFITIGVGHARNKLKNTEEHSGGSLVTMVHDNTESSVAYKLGLGFDQFITNNLVFTFSLDHYNLGKFSTGGHRHWVSGYYSGTTWPIGPWVTKTVSFNQATAGLKLTY